MDVPYERETEEVISEDLQTRIRSSKVHHPTKSRSLSSSSSITSDSSDTSNNFEYSSSVNTMSSNTIFTNGEYTKTIEEEAVLSDAQKEGANFEEPIVLQNGETNGFAVHQNGVGVDEFSIAKSNGTDKETDSESNASSFSKSPETSVGLQFVLDEKSNGVNVAPSEMYNGENILNKTLVVNGQSEIVETGQSQDEELEVDVYDVEGVIRKQESHDFYCPNCEQCITKRVILKRRKRKLDKISRDEPNLGQTDHPVTNEVGPEAEHPQGEKALGDRIDAISCFSCFRIFIPKGDGFLCWSFKPKPAVIVQPGGSGDPLIGSMDSEAQSGEDKTVFPLWILTCCQPYHTKKPVPRLESKSSLTSGNDTSVPDADRLKSQHVPKAGGEVPTGEEENILAQSDESKVPLWFVTCGQPSSEEKKQGHPGPEVSSKVTECPPPSQGTSVPSSLLPSSTPDYGTSVTSDTQTHVTSDTQSHLTSGEGTIFPFWFLTCCQPSVDSNKPKPVMNLEEPVPSPATKTQIPSEVGKGVESRGKEPPPPHSEETPIPPNQEPPLKSEPHKDAGPLVLPKPDPYNDIQSPGPEAPPTPPKGKEVILQIPNETPILPPSFSQHYTSEVGPTPSNKLPLHEPLLEPSRSRVSGMDIIKAIVYGGLLECITSLSVIASAAGGDATTLNIVALGLANVFGGLVLLLHNLRVLKHEHATERYEDQLGRPGHYLLHAVVAVISYLVFGLMSPIIYGFAFRKSDNKDYKLATIATASLVCIALLSIAKAYVRRPPKEYVKTVLYYVSMGFMVSGAGYVAGDLINELLKKLGVFDHRAPVAMPLFEAGELKGAWLSY